MTARTRWLLLAAAGVGTWSGWIVMHRDADAPPPAPAMRSSRPAAPAPQAAPATQVALAPLAASGRARAASAQLQGNAFEARDWAPPPPPPPPPPPVVVVTPPPPPPPAPPPPPQLPYRLVGLMETGPSTAPKVFLSLNDKLLIAAAGDTLEGGYRLDSISARELVFTHLQLNLQLRLSVQGASS